MEEGLLLLPGLINTEWMSKCIIWEITFLSLCLIFGVMAKKKSILSCKWVRIYSFVVNILLVTWIRDLESKIKDILYDVLLI